MPRTACPFLGARPVEPFCDLAVAALRKALRDANRARWSSTRAEARAWLMEGQGAVWLCMIAPPTVTTSDLRTMVIRALERQEAN